MMSLNIEYFFTGILPKLFAGTLFSLIIGSVVGSIIGLIVGKLMRRINDAILPAILGSALGTLLFAMLPILSEPAMRDGGGPYGAIYIMMVLIVGGIPGAVIGAIVGSICGLKLPRHLKPRMLGITLAVVYSLMTVVMYGRTAPPPFQFIRNPSSEQEILPLVGKITGYEDSLCCLAFTPDGQQLVTVKNGDLRVWQISTGKVLRRFDGPPASRLSFQDRAVRMVIASDGKTAIISAPEAVRIRDLNTGQILQEFEGDYYSQVTPDGQTLVSFVGSQNSPKTDIGVWDIPQGKQRYFIPFGIPIGISTYEEVAPFDVSPDGKTLIVAPTPYTDRVEIWQLETGKLLKFVGGGARVAITTVAVTSDGKRVVMAGGGTLRVLALDTGETVKTIPNVGRVKTLLLTPDDQIVISSGDKLSFWNLSTGESLKSWPNEFGKLADQVALSPDGKLLAAYGQDEVVKLWQMP